MPSLTAPQDVHIIMCAVPAYGHFRPMRSLARRLAERGYSISFTTGSALEKSVTSIKGVEFVPLQGLADFGLNLDEAFPGRKGLGKGMDRMFFDLEHVFFRPMPDQFNTVQGILKRPELQKKKFVIFSDAAFLGHLPMLLGSPQAIRAPVVGVGSFPLMMLSKDTAPFGLGLPSQGEEANMALNAQTTEVFKPAQDMLEKIMKPFNCTKPFPSKFPTDNFFLTPDLYIQCSVPGLEPPRRDLPSNIHYIGVVPGGNEKKPLPEWFQEFVLDDTTGHPLILLTQGTVTGSSPAELILPTIEGCKDLNVRVIVCGVHLEMPKDKPLPKNVRWAEWIAFEEVFPHTSIVISNGGFGGICQAFAEGIPMVVSGTTEDKTETTMRAEASGAAINLRTEFASPEQVKDAVTKIISNPSYKEKAMKLKKEFAECDPVGSVVSFIDQLTKEFYP